MKHTIIILLSPQNTSPYYAYKTLGAEFSIRGFNIIFIDISSPAFDAEILHAAENNSIAFVLTHNTFKIDLKINEQSFYEKYKALCICIVDTPLPKYEQIKGAGKNTALMIGDFSFKNMIHSINPEISIYRLTAFNVLTVNFENKPIHERRTDVLFAGRIGDFENALEGYRFFKRKLGKYIARAYGFQNEIQIDEVIKKLPEKTIMEKLFKFFLHLNLSRKETWDYLWSIVKYIRAQRRNFIMNELLTLPESIRVKIITDNAQANKMKQFKKTNIEVLEFMPWADVVNEIRDSKITVNVMPYHVYSFHERIAAAQYCSSVTVTDENPYLREKFMNEEDILFYSYESNNLSNVICNALQKGNVYLQNIADNAFKKSDEHSPSNMADYILKIYDNMKINYPAN